MNEWQPIETAPKGGDTQILVCGSYSTDIAIVRWDGKHWLCVSDGYSVVEYMSDFGTEYRTFQVPSHWMPLPALPIDGAAVGKV